MAIAEITLIGTGGYGECVVVNLGNDNWIIIDSCINPETKSPLSIEYLESIKVNLSNVKLIICTHWHDDHILGISSALEKCPNAKFSTSRAHEKEKFKNFLSFDSQKDIIGNLNSSTREFLKCLKIINQRTLPIVGAISDRTLFSVVIGEHTNQIISLSPSDFTIENSDHEIGQLISDFNSTNKKVIVKSPNTKSVALFVKIGTHRAILGADLEVSHNRLEGWFNIIDNAQTIDSRASLFKIPHHGSENGYHPSIWDVLLDDNPVAKITPYNKNSKLPQVEMVQIYSEHTDKLFITSPVIGVGKPKSRDRQIEKFIKKMEFKLQEIKFSKGIIRSQIDFTNLLATWNTDLSFAALNINAEM